MIEEPPEGMKDMTWTWWPEDTLDCLDLLLVYMGVNRNLQRPPLTAPVNHKKPSEDHVPMRRAVGLKAWRSAVTLLFPCRRRPLPQHGMFWCMHPRTDYRDRLALAGIDIDTVQIMDRRKFAFAWRQITEGFHPKFSRDKQMKFLESDEKTPHIGPFTKTCWVKPRKSVALQLKEAAEELRKKNWDANDAAERGIDLEPVNTIGQALEKQRKL